MLTSTAGLVERVVLLGAPISIGDENWEVARKVPRTCLNLLFIYFKKNPLTFENF
jgi:hypothetical protein